MNEYYYLGFQDDQQLKLYITNPRKKFITIDNDKILENTDIFEQLTSPTSGIFEEYFITREVIVENGEYQIRSVENRSDSGVVFKLVALLSPIGLGSKDLDDYDFVVIMLQDNRPIEQFSQGLEDVIQSEFWFLMAIIVGSSIFLCILIGLCLFWSTRKITQPIKKLTFLTSNIKKEHKIEEIRKTVKNHELFKRFRNENNKNNNTANQDEIQELISIFYNFFIEDNNEEQKNNVLKMNNYEYPKNLYNIQVRHHSLQQFSYFYRKKDQKKNRRLALEVEKLMAAIAKKAMNCSWASILTKNYLMMKMTITKQVSLTALKLF